MSLFGRPKSPEDFMQKAEKELARGRVGLYRAWVDKWTAGSMETHLFEADLFGCGYPVTIPFIVTPRFFSSSGSARSARRSKC